MTLRPLVLLEVKIECETVALKLDVEICFVELKFKGN